MAFFPHVNKGEPFQPNSVLENNIRDLVNASSRIGGRSTKGSADSSLHDHRQGNGVNSRTGNFFAQECMAFLPVNGTSYGLNMMQ